MTQAFLLENQVVDILPNLVVRERRALEEGGIVTVADLTTCDSQGRHWHPDLYNWPLLEEGVRGRDLPQHQRQLKEGQVCQAFSLDKDGKARGAYSIKEVLSIAADDEITYRLWGPEPGVHPHPLETGTNLTANRPDHDRSNTFTDRLENFLKGDHFRNISIGTLRHGKGHQLEATVLRATA